MALVNVEAKVSFGSPGKFLGAACAIVAALVSPTLKPVLLHLDRLLQLHIEDENASARAMDAQALLLEQQARVAAAANVPASSTSIGAEASLTNPTSMTPAQADASFHDGLDTETPAPTVDQSDVPYGTYFGRIASRQGERKQDLIERNLLMLDCISRIKHFEENGWDGVWVYLSKNISTSDARREILKAIADANEEAGGEGRVDEPSAP